MPFKKGQAKPAASGRKPGVSNKSTDLVREAIARFADGNVEKLAVWVERMAKNDPKGAADIFLRAIEYHIPKLGRTELTGQDGEKLSVSVSITRTVKDDE